MPGHVGVCRADVAVALIHARCSQPGVSGGVRARGAVAACPNASSASSRWSKLYFDGVCTVMFWVWTDTAGGRPVRVPHRVKRGDSCITVVCWPGRLPSY
jgi:hypothetical protein